MRNLDIAYNKLEKLKKEAELWKMDINASMISRKFNKEFRSLSVRFQFHIMDTYFAAGEYDPHRDSTEDPKYSVFLGYDRNFSIWLWVNTIEFYEEIFLILAHEFRHGYQHRKRKYKTFSRPHRKRMATMFDYYKNADELDSYAYEAAHAVKLFESKKSSVKDYWVAEVYRREVKPVSLKAYKRFLKKLYLHTRT